MSDSEMIPLTMLAAELVKVFGEKAPRLGYRQIYAQVLNGDLPAEQFRGRWYVRCSDLKTICRILRSGRAVTAG